MNRLLIGLAVLSVVAPAASAQPYYNALEDDRGAALDASPGVRVGLGVGPYVYRGPDILTGDLAFQDDVVATNLGITAELTAPLSGDRLYGRLVGGLLNIGADDDRADSPPGTNPFLTSQTVLAEANLLYYVTPPRPGGLSPYVFSGLSGLFATDDGVDGVETTALAVPVGVGLEYGASRNLSLFAEASYRFGITDVGGAAFGAVAAARTPDVCDKESPDYDEEKCLEKGGTPTPTCEQDPTQERCDEVLGEVEEAFDGRFGSALVLGGVRLGFNPAPPVVIPPPPPPVPVAPPPPPEPEVPEVCDLIELNAVTFDYGSTTLDLRARRLLDENVELLLASPACCVFIDGYVDEAESDEFGAPVSERRARAVYDYYVSRGIAEDRLQVRNRGLAVPSCDKEDPGPGCGRNRRVESLPVDCERFEFLIENPSYDPY